MARIRVNRRLQRIVWVYNANANLTVAALFSTASRPNTYQSDGPGHNYTLRQRRWSNIENFRRGLITAAQLEARSEYKWGETGRGIGERRRGYKKCLKMYEIVWIASYTTPTRKLTESLVHDELRVLGLQVPFTDCSCGHRHREWFSFTSIGGNTEAALEYVFARWMALRGNLKWHKEYL
ncbi:hypothetical protein C8F04DRAFT_1178200 [Mycena alexandri]|uniref:Bacteriophage T5 Orf172 DNA-binding domain-containing protein n=1 Tax=Mycena alexandri TaxID=1745969 RepID=A0AAD6T6K6_9AGAR|nr:hypothetical protein C8F04DRAFT_1178200 [Mycena alexandri]